MRRLAFKGWWLVGLLAIAVSSWWLIFPGYNSANNVAQEATLEKEPAKPKDFVQLDATRREVFDLATTLVEKRLLQPRLAVPGKILYDADFHVELKASSDGTLTKVLVKPGDHVKRGEVLAILSSPEIGSARADVLNREQTLAQARQEVEWQKKTKRGIIELLQAINADQPLDQLETILKELVLGESREKLVTAYTRYVTAKTTWEKTKSLGEGVLSERVVRERENEQIAARGALSAVCEQTAHDLRLRDLAVQRAVDDAQRRLEISQQHVTTLLGYEEVQEPLRKDGSAISQVEFRAPFDGIIESRTYAANERVKQGDPLFVLADTKQLWVQADLRESNWSALKLSPNSEIEVELPAFPGQHFTARLFYLGREISLNTLALPIIAKLDNPRGELRPGLFARVSLPYGDAIEALAIPESAITQDAGEQLVFIEEAPGKFRRQAVQLGVSASGWVQVTEGLRLGEKVVSRGVFLLKSELLLEAEE